MTNEENESLDSPDSLDELFEEESTDVTEDVTEDSTGEDEPKDESKDESEDEPKEDAETPADKEPTLVPIAALQDERRKAKLLKEEIETLKLKVPELDEAPDPEEDLEAYNAYMRNQWEQEQFEEQSKVFIEKAEASRSVMLEKYDDYKQVEEVFYILANLDEGLKQDMFDSKDPALFAYTKGKEYLQSQRDTIIAELEAKKNPDLPTKSKSESFKAPSLASATAQDSNSTEVEKDENLDDMFEDQAY